MGRSIENQRHQPSVRHELLNLASSDMPGKPKSMMDQVDIQDDHSPADDETPVEQSDVTRIDKNSVSKADTYRQKKIGGYAPLKRKAKTQIQYKNLDASSESEDYSEDDPDFIPDTKSPLKMRITTRRQSGKMKEIESQKGRKGSKKAKSPKKEKTIKVAKRCTPVKIEKAGKQVKKTENVKFVTKVYVPKGSSKCCCRICQKSLKILPALKKHLALKHKYISSEFYRSRIILKKVIHHSFIRKLVKVEDHPDVQTSPRNEESTRDSQKVYSSEMTKEERSKGQMKCKVCSKAFSHYSSLVKHVREQHVTVLRMDKNGLYYKLEKHLKMKMKLFETKKRGSSYKQGKRKVLEKSVPVKCYLCYNKLASDRVYSEHLMNVHGHDYEKAREISGFPKRKMTFNEDANSTCPECNLTFKGAKELKGHLKKAHNFDDFSYSCPECHNTYYSLVAIRSHLRWIHGKNFMQIKEIIGQMLHCEAENCEFRTGNMHEMKMHVMKMHPSVRFKCRICRSVFYSKIIYNQHMNVKHLRSEDQIKRKCNVCGKFLSQRSYLKVHQYRVHGIRHEGVKIFTCSIEGCGLQCFSRFKLKEHKKSHSEERNFECPHCHIKLKSKLTYKNHINKVHLGIRPFLCQFCGKTFGTNGSRKRHVEYHHAKKEFQCKECKYGTGSKAAFYSHLYKVHKIQAEDDKREEIKCPQCDYRTIFKCKFVIHMKRHKNILEHICNICNKQFLTDGALKSHKEWKHSENKHKCNQCNYETKTKGKLNEHIRVQHILEGVKPYKCHYCSFTCATSANTLKHIKLKHKGLEVKYTRDESLLEAAKRAQKSGTSILLS